MITAFASLSLTLEAINNVGIFRLLIKPFEENEILEAVSDGLRYYRMNKKAQSFSQTVSLKDKEPLLHEVISESVHELKNQLLVVGLSSENAMEHPGNNSFEGMLHNLQRIKAGTNNMVHIRREG